MFVHLSVESALSCAAATIHQQCGILALQHVYNTHVAWTQAFNKSCTLTKPYSLEVVSTVPNRETTGNVHETATGMVTDTSTKPPLPSKNTEVSTTKPELSTEDKTQLGMTETTGHQTTTPASKETAGEAVPEPEPVPQPTPEPEPKPELQPTEPKSEAEPTPEPQAEPEPEPEPTSATQKPIEAENPVLGHEQEHHDEDADATVDAEAEPESTTTISLSDIRTRGNANLLLTIIPAMYF